jgi:hypothetical protein
MTEMLRLMALDAEDLAVVSANLQDAEVDPSALTYQTDLKRFVFVAGRYDWVKARTDIHERCQAGIHFDHVLKVTHQGLDARQDRPSLTLLGILFQPVDAPGGNIVLTFSCGAAVRLEVECIEASLADIGPRWTVEGPPQSVQAV